MGTLQDVLNVAQGEIGVKESPAGSNCVKYNTWFYGREVSGSAYPWCAAFVSWVLHEAGVGELCVRSASCPAIKSDAQRRGAYHAGSSGISAGDLVLYQFDGDADPDHIGIVESVSGSAIIAIEGNTSVTSADNGGCVMRQLRARSCVMGYVRLNLNTTPASHCGYSADSFIRDVQFDCGVSVDGVVGTQTRNALPEISRDKNMRHMTVGHIQTRLFALGYCVGPQGADGVYGRQTDNAVRAFQKARGLQSDGIVGPLTWNSLFAA